MTYIVRWGWSNEHKVEFASFYGALSMARDVMDRWNVKNWPSGYERPTIRHALNADEDTDGLTPEQREACEAIGLEADRP